MYRAKEQGRNNIQLFTAEMSERFRDRLMREEELHSAIERDELITHYQPLLHRESRTMIGVEALLALAAPRARNDRPR
jgi:Predicted signal transduction protein containing a membrane domain, an EAL and a GGDEF domain